MKTSTSKITLFLLLSLAFLGVSSFRFQTPIVQQSLPSFTPTYDPFVETPLPANPTELELGQNLYWHWCMPCHGDRGQGLTDEFRGFWEPDHQNCWARGCHIGRVEDQGFPIPTVVPGIVDDNHLAQFTSLQEFADYLKATHPPQSPGVLKDGEYHAIALFVFTMNGRSIAPPTTVPVPLPTETLIPSTVSTASPYVLPIKAIVVLTILTAVVFVLIIRRNGRME
jgi:hypothetical protein